MNGAPTIKDVARRAGVSVATASNVVNGARPVGEESRRAVNAAISELGYRVNRAAASLRNRRSRLVGMVVPDIANVFFAGMVDCVEAEAERAGYDLLIASSSEDTALERRRIEALIGRRVDGLIVAPSTDASTQWCAELGPSAPPIVLIDRGDETLELDTVGAANESGGYEATRHLIARGHRDIAALAYNVEIGNVCARIAGYRRALAEAGLSERARIVVSAPGVENLRAAIEHDLHRKDRASAIFALTNHSSLAAIKAVRGLGLDIPGDISIVGFDDVDWMCALRPYLTTVAQPIEAIAARSWNLLVRRIAGETDARQHIRLPCTLNVRESTGFVRPRLKTRAASQI